MCIYFLNIKFCEAFENCYKAKSCPLNCATMSDNPCIFCLDEQRNPRHIRCGHSFCADCFEHYLKLGLDSRCPLCRLDFRGDGADDARSIITSNQGRRQETAIGLGDLYTNFDYQNDILMLTLSEQECRLFEELHQEVLQRLANEG
ncbi:uncharacterized protein LOC6651359 [Drosophila willistoni]|nr:uncharacterized protein LOC6651359 [Drosophila willistoni]